MKKFVLFGETSMPSETIALMCHQSYFQKECIGQVVHIPGKGLRVRKTQPQLETMTLQQVIIAAEELVAFTPPCNEIRALCQKFNVPIRLLSESFAPCYNQNPMSFQVTFNPDSFSRVLPGIISVLKRNYRLNLYSTDPALNQILQLFHPFKNNADLDVYLIPDSNATLFDPKFPEHIVKRLHTQVSANIYLSRMYSSYQSIWQHSVHTLPSADTDGKEFLYGTCTQRILPLEGALRKVFNALRSGNILSLKQMNRWHMEVACSVLAEEGFRSRHIALLLSTHHPRIANKQDVILSFLGSRRCNFRCDYCFSDHRCEDLSRMSEADTLRVADMVTADRQEGLNLHIDTNLGGEPLMDFDAVKTRHNLMEAYHKTTGIAASFGLLTNGSLLEKRHLDWLRTHIPYVGFSLDGDPTMQNRIRRDANLAPTYDRVKKGVELVQNSNWPVETGVSCVLTRYNLDIKGLQEHFRKELDLHHVVMKPVRAAESEPYALAYADLPHIKAGYRVFFEHIYEEAAAGNLDPLFTMLQPLDYAGRFFLRTYFADRLIVKRCGAGEIIFSTDDKGCVYPCDSFNGVAEKELGNLSEGMHNHSGFAIPYVTEKPDPYKCQSCWARYLCGGICEHVTHLNEGKYNNVLKMECEYAKFLVTSALAFWANARIQWSKETLEQVTAYIHEMGVVKLQENSFVYAPC